MSGRHHFKETPEDTPGPGSYSTLHPNSSKAYSMSG